MNKKKVLFLTGTRADYGKLKPLIISVEESDEFECYIFVTGMHTLKDFGDTKNEIYKDGFKNIHVYMNQIIEEPMDLVLANTINGFSRYIKELEPDMIIVHGDRVEALAGAICGAINNILVAHIEGGEISGTIDESIRHSITKLSHIHFVSNIDAKNRLLQLGELESSIFVIGTADIDVILEKSTLNIDKIKERYEIYYEKYSVLMYHPVTTEIEKTKKNIKELVDAVFESKDNFIVIYPNNDTGHRSILEEYERFKGYNKVKTFPSIRFEFFIEILKNAEYLIGNSSAGIHEAPVIGLPSINIGSRQNGRFKFDSIIDSPQDKISILNSIKKSKSSIGNISTKYFGEGKSKEKFIEAISKDDIWKISTQKIFNSL